MTSGVAILLMLLGGLLCVAAIRGTYSDVAFVFLHPATSPGKESSGSTTAEPNPVGSEPGNNQHE